MANGLPPLWSGDQFIPFALPDVGAEEIAAVSSAIASGWLSSGPRVREFELAFAARFGQDVEAVAVNSATAGLHLALEACGIGPGDEVLLPTWTFTATAEVVRYLGATPVLVDVDRESLNIDFERAEELVTSRTRVVIPVHFAGRPVPSRLLREFAEARGIEVVEDAAHAFPAASEGELVGAGTSRATVFSFYATKTMTTGEGGMVVTRDVELANRVRTMRLHGIDRDAFNRYRSDTPAWRYEVVDAGYKYNLTDPAAAMGLVQLRRVDAMRARRQEIAEAYLAAFDETSLELPAPAPRDVLHAWHLFVARLPRETDREAFISAMSKAGIGTSVHFIPLHLQPYWRDSLGCDSTSFPVATQEFERVVSLPLFSGLRDEQVSRIIEAVRRSAPK